MITFRSATLAAAMLFACSNSHAAQSSREALIADFTHALGIEAIIESSQRQTQQATIAQGDMVVDNLRRAGLSEAALKDIETSFDEVMRSVVSSWTPEEASRIYASAIADAMSDEDLAASVAFYRSEEGRRSISAAGEASTQLQNYIQDAMTKAMEPALKQFMVKVQVITAADRQKRAQSGK